MYKHCSQFVPYNKKMQTSSLFCFETDFESIGKSLNYKISNNPAERLGKYRQLFGSVDIDFVHNFSTRI